LHDWSLALAADHLDADFSVQTLMEIMELLWSPRIDWPELWHIFPSISPLFLFVSNTHHVLVDHSFFSLNNGFAGIGLPDMQGVGDRSSCDNIREWVSYALNDTLDKVIIDHAVLVVGIKLKHEQNGPSSLMFLYDLPCCWRGMGGICVHLVMVLAESTI
jgi:hypothetical protein